MISKQDILSTLQKEFATTEKVMRAYPADHMSFAPHERSQATKRLMATFVFEMYLLRGYLLGESIAPDAFRAYAKESLDALLADFKTETAAVIAGIESLDEDTYQHRTISFGGATFTADRFILMMLFDQIHHRGQLSVYVRLAGGKVPSIYGPSADDPSTNL